MDSKSLLLISTLMEAEKKVSEFYATTEPSPYYELTNVASFFKLNRLVISDQSTRFGLQSFKAIGALFAITKLLTQKQNLDVFCTATDGNHGRAVAYTAKRLGKKAVIVVPRHTSPARIKAIKDLGADVIETQMEYDNAVRCAASLVASNNDTWALIQDTAWDGYTEIPMSIMQGYLQICLELDHLFPKEAPMIDIVLLQAGVGSFAASVAGYLTHRYGKHRPTLVCVEPKESDCILESIKNKRRSTTLQSQTTIVTGLNCGTPSLIAYPILEETCHHFITVEDSRVEHWMKALYTPKENDPQLISGEAGAAVGLAGLEVLQLKNINTKGKRVLIFNTESNTDPDSFQSIVG
jgi:diaminopropionate ammonia-lyase